MEPWKEARSRLGKLHFQKQAFSVSAIFKSCATPGEPGQQFSCRHGTCEDDARFMPFSFSESCIFKTCAVPSGTNLRKQISEDSENFFGFVKLWAGLLKLSPVVVSLVDS